MNIRKRKAAAAAERLRKNLEEFNKMKQEEDDKLRKKSELSSELLNVLSELLKNRDCIQSCIQSKKNKLLEEINKRMSSFVIDFLSNPSTEPPPEAPQFQFDESFLQFLSTQKPILEEISEQISFIDKLIQKISSNSSDISESEQRIIDILSSKSFLRSQVVASVQIMINFCSKMRDCLEVLGTYSEQIISQMNQVITGELCKKKRYLDEFEINSMGLKLQHQNLNELSQELSELQGKIDEMETSFSEKYSIACLFMESDKSDEFSSVSERTRKLDIEIEQMKLRFHEVKEIFVEKFVQPKFNYLYDFVTKVRNDEYLNSVGESENMSDHIFFWDNYSEPAKDLRKRLEDSLNRIKHIRV